MSNPVTNAFFLGRALAEVLSEKIEESLTNAMSELGKFDAEQRENLRQFIEEVELRAERVAANSPDYNSSVSNNYHPTPDYSFNTNSGDLQAMLDQLRAEIASLRAELQKYRN
jgi:methyl-accepting chemotaxis protein